MTRARWGWTAAWLAAGALAAAAAWSRPLGANTDEALFIVLARSLRAGSFAVPGPLGWTVTDPWPGYPLLLSLPEALVGERWALYRLVGLAAWAALAAAAWRLARRLAGPESAPAAALLTALCPGVLEQAGQLTPDLAFAACCAAALAAFGGAGSALVWAAPAALAGIMKPHGALLLAALLCAAAARRRRRDALAAALACLPLLVLLARNRLAAGTVTDYAAHWLAQPGATLAARAQGLLGVTLGRGLLGLGSWAGAAALGCAVWAARGWARRSAPPCAAASAFFAAGVLALHLAWSPQSQRYAAVVAPAAFAALAAARLPRRLKLAGAVVLAASFAVAGARRGAASRSAPTIPQPETMAWLAARTPPDARVESFSCMPVRLFARRDSSAPDLWVSSRDAWVASLLSRRVDYVHLAGFRSDGYFPETARLTASSQELWARSLPSFSMLYDNPREGASVYRAFLPDGARYLRAWALFEAAGADARAGASADEVRGELDAALRVDGRIGVAWAARGALTAEPRARLSYFERAAKADPTSRMIREDLEAARARARSRRGA